MLGSDRGRSSASGDGGRSVSSDSSNSLGTAEDGRVYDFICVVDDALFSKKVCISYPSCAMLRYPGSNVTV